MTDILSIAGSGIAASQSAINVTGQNIANVSSVGYSREVLNQTTAASGIGTQIVDISRVYDEFLASQANTSLTTSSHSNIQYAQIQSLDAILTDPNAGISSALSSFFNALQNVSNNPADIPSRQTAIGAAQGFVGAVSTVQSTIDSINTNINTQMQQSVNRINEYATQLKTLNVSIAGSTDSSILNSLKDQRDSIINLLSKEMKVTVNSSSGQYIVSLGNGIPLLNNSTIFPLATQSSTSKPNELDVSFNGQFGATLNTKSMAGGIIGGLIDFRQNILEPAQNKIGLVALGLATAINKAQSLGSSLISPTPPAIGPSVGHSLFSVVGNGGVAGQIPVHGSTLNGANAPTVTASLIHTNDISQVTASDYKVTFDGTNLSLMRNSDQTVVSSHPLTNSQPQLFADGIQVSVPPGMRVGDSYLVTPTTDAGRNLSLITSDPLAIAAAASPTSSLYQGNNPPVTSVGPGDNTNMANILGVQSAKILGNNTTSLDDSFNSFISSIGSQAHELKVKSDFDTSIQQKSYQAMQNVNGVNLDEEAANLIRFQQAYQASGKVMQIAKQMFDTLMTLSQ